MMYVNKNLRYCTNVEVSKNNILSAFKRTSIFDALVKVAENVRTCHRERDVLNYIL